MMNLTIEQRARLARAAGRFWSPALYSSDGWPTLTLDELFALLTRLVGEDGWVAEYIAGVAPERSYSVERTVNPGDETLGASGSTLREALEQAVLRALEANDELDH